MKKTLAWILSLVLLIGVTGTVSAFADDKPGPLENKGAAIVAIFADEEVCPVIAPEDLPKVEDEILTDAILIYYSDNTFEQYAQTPSGYEPYRSGTYTFKGEGDFNLSEDEDEDILEIEIQKQHSTSGMRPVDVSETSEFKLGAIRNNQIYGPKDGREIVAVFCDDNAIIHTNESGVISKLDAIWIYFIDNTFAEYVLQNGEVVPFGSGTYEFNETGDFNVDAMEEDHGTITISWKESVEDLAGKSLTFDLGTMGFVRIYAKQDALP